MVILRLIPIFSFPGRRSAPMDPLSARSGNLMELADSPIKPHQPKIISCTPNKTRLEGVLVPPLIFQNSSDTNRNFLREYLEEIQEWLGLVSLDSPCLYSDNPMDPYLCRYKLPEYESCKKINLIKLSWKGFFPPEWITQLLIALQ